MTLFIYNHRLTGEQQAVDAQSIAEDQSVLWQGDSWEQFTKETGLSEAEIGGIVKENGKLLFSIEKKAESERLKLPLANGSDLVKFIERAFIGQSFETRTILQSLFAPVKATLESETCVELSNQDFKSALNMVENNQSLTTQQKGLFLGLANQWAGSVRFSE
jgi:hypothetical protein